MRELIPEGRIICFCRGVSEETIRRAIKDGARTLQGVQQMTGACTGNDCARLHPEGRCCAPDILVLLERESEIADGKGLG